MRTSDHAPLDGGGSQDLPGSDSLTAIVNADEVVVVDVSDTTEGANGTTKVITLANLLRQLILEDALDSKVETRVAASTAQHRTAGEIGWLFFEDPTAWENDHSGLTYPDNTNEFHVFKLEGFQVEFESLNGDVVLKLEGAATGAQSIYGLQRGPNDEWAFGIDSSVNDLQWVPNAMSIDGETAVMVLKQAGHLELGGTVAPDANTTGNRPSTGSLATGAMFFDTTLGHPIWWDGTNWVDATGTTV